MRRVLAGTLHDHHFVVQEADGAVVGAAYYAHEPLSDRMWNLYFIAVSPSRQGQGIGAALLDHVERELRQAGPDTAQVLIVETSSTDQYALTRAFYPKQGYVEEGRICALRQLGHRNRITTMILQAFRIPPFERASFRVRSGQSSCHR